MVLLRLVVTHIDLRTELHLLDLDTHLFLSCRLGLTILLVLVLAVIHDLAYRRLRVGGNLNKVHVLVVRDAQSILHAKEPEL